MRVANARKNFLHEETTIFARKHGIVVLEAVSDPVKQEASGVLPDAALSDPPRIFGRSAHQPTETADVDARRP